MGQNSSKANADVVNSLPQVSAEDPENKSILPSNSSKDDKGSPSSSSLQDEHGDNLIIYRSGIIETKGINLWGSAEFELCEAKLPGLRVFVNTDLAMTSDHDIKLSNASRVLCFQSISCLPEGWELVRTGRDVFLCPPKSVAVNIEFVQKTFQKQEWKNWTAVAGYRIFKDCIGFYHDTHFMSEFATSMIVGVEDTGLREERYESFKDLYDESSSQIAAPKKSYNLDSILAGKSAAYRHSCRLMWTQHEGLKFVLENIEKLDESLDSSILNGFRWHLVLMSKVMENVVNDKPWKSGLRYDVADSPYVYCANKVIVEFTGDDDRCGFDLDHFSRSTWYHGQDLYSMVSKLLEKNGHEKMIDLDY